MDDARLELERYDDTDLATLPLETALDLSERLPVLDNGFNDADDLRERLRLMKRKNNNSGHKPFPQFSRVQADAGIKRKNLLDIVQNIQKVFHQTPTETVSSTLISSLSEILSEEGLLSNDNLLDEMTERTRILQTRETIIIVAGETNSGKSTFLNLLLGEEILPTYSTHCTYVVCKITYWHSYCVETVDYNDVKEEYFCDNCQEAREKLREVVTCDNIRRREQSSRYKEIILRMPSEILKSGITFVDTPGIGENDAMDEVTITFVKESLASAFIYIIKSDCAGGVQEDRLMAFLRAVKEHYTNRLEGTFDPQAAMFVCHRWDATNPSEREKVRRNALVRLEMVWPGFQPDQTFLFSSKKTNMHLDVDKEFITDSFNDLLKGLKQLIDRATHNMIKYQYCWAKTFVHPTCRHLRSLITHCTSSNEALESHFREVAEKQDALGINSSDRVPSLNKMFNDQRESLMSQIGQILSLKDLSKISDLDDYDFLLSMISEDRFLNNSVNCHQLDQQIIACLMRYCEDFLIREDILKVIEDTIMAEIKDHLSLFEYQVDQIKKDMHGNDMTRARSTANFHGTMAGQSLGSSINSGTSFSSDTEDSSEMTSFTDPMILNEEVESFLQRRKQGQPLKNIFKSGLKLGKKIIDKIGESAGPNSNPKQYLEHRIRKLATDMGSDLNCIGGLVKRCLRLPERCIIHAIHCIPQFIDKNTRVMKQIRTNREAFHEDKEIMKNVMERLEPFRSQLQGYGSLYMEDLNADQINFEVGRRMSTVYLESKLRVSVVPDDDSGFIGSGSSKHRVRSFWAYIRNARMIIDKVSEHVTIKTYTFTITDTQLYSEIAALRCFENEHVASFFGMTRINSANTDDLGNAESTIPSERMHCFIFKGQLCSAAAYQKNKMIDIHAFIPSFLFGLWHGLEFIHREKLVHLELNLNTVMVDSQYGTVKLCQQCKPRVAQLPVNPFVKTNAAVCLSPSVLHGNIYGISDDIYALGVLFWDLLFPNNPSFKEQRNWPLEKFIKEVNTGEMLKPQLNSMDISEPVRELLDGCLCCTRDTVITMKDILRLVEKIQNDPAIASVKTRRSKPPIRIVSRGTSSGCEELQSTSPDDQEQDVFSLDQTDSKRSSWQTTSVESSTASESQTPVAPPRRHRRVRPTRHSQIVAPNLSDLEIPAQHQDRRTSLPNLPLLTLQEKCNRFELTSQTHEEPSSIEKQTSTLCMRGRSIPAVVLEEAGEDSGREEPVLLRVGSNRSTHSRGSCSSFEPTIENIVREYTSPLQPCRKSADEKKVQAMSIEGIPSLFQNHKKKCGLSLSGPNISPNHQNGRRECLSIHNDSRSLISMSTTSDATNNDADGNEEFDSSFELNRSHESPFIRNGPMRSMSPRNRYKSHDLRRNTDISLQSTRSDSLGRISRSRSNTLPVIPSVFSGVDLSSLCPQSASTSSSNRLRTTNEESSDNRLVSDSCIQSTTSDDDANNQRNSGDGASSFIFTPIAASMPNTEGSSNGRVSFVTGDPEEYNDFSAFLTHAGNDDEIHNSQKSDDFPNIDMNEMDFD